MRLSHCLAALALATSASAQNVTRCVSGGVCYAVNIPAASSSSGSGDIFVQITGPSSLSWIGLGQGSRMSGANIFIIYANAAGNNVTLSPRLGVGEVEPKTSGSTAQVTLLGGSGISNSIMTANFKCSNCNSWSGGSMDFTNSQSDWIWAFHSGRAISSNSLAASITQHTSNGDFTLNLQNAAGGSSANPFLAAASSETPSSGNNTSGSTDDSTGGNTSGNANGNASDDSDSSSDDESTSGPNRKTILLAHGILVSLAFVLFYPLGAIAIRVLSFPNLVWFHAGWMCLSYLIALAGMGLGVWYAVNGDYLSTNHAIIGLVVVGCLVLQPISGLAHHLIFKRTGRPSAATYPHIWWGRAVVTLGMINGGLGLQLTANKKGQIAYGVTAGFMWVLWMGIIVFSFIKGRGKAGTGSMEGTKAEHSPSLQPDSSIRNSSEMRERQSASRGG